MPRGPGRKTLMLLRTDAEGQALKTCRKCDEVKPLGTGFYKVAKNGDKYENRCRICAIADSRRYREQNPERVQKWRRESRGRQSAAERLRLYGLTPARHAALLKKQGGVCAICGNPETRILRGTLTCLNVDHDHKTGRVRGLLCWACNMGLGRLGDSLERVRAAVSYLERHNASR